MMRARKTRPGGMSRIWLSLVLGILCSPSVAKAQPGLAEHFFSAGTSTQADTLLTPGEARIFSHWSRCMTELSLCPTREELHALTRLTSSTAVQYSMESQTSDAWLVITVAILTFVSGVVVGAVL